MKIWNEYRRIMENQRGAFLVLMVVILPLILIFAGLAVDLGRGYSHRAKLQNAADAAVMAAAHIYFPNKDRNEVYEWAQRYMDANRGDQTYKIDQITVRELKDSNSAENSILLSVYASELVPVSFMAIAGFDAIPVDVVATAKIIPGKENTDPGVWGYAFICGDDRDVSQSGWAENAPFYITNDGHKIVGKVHSNGAIAMQRHPPRDGVAHYDVVIDRGDFSTSLDSNSELWFTRSEVNYDHPNGEAATGVNTYDIKDGNDWYYLQKFGYTDGIGAATEVVVDSTTKTSKLNISMSQPNAATKAIYDYVENMRITSGEWKEPQWDTKKSDNFVRTTGNYGEYTDHSNGFQVWYTQLSYKVIIADGDLQVQDNHLDKSDGYVVLISLHGDINLALNSSVKALVYAPNGRVSYKNEPGTTFEGSIVGKQISLNVQQNSTYIWNDFGFGSGSGGSGSGGSSTGSAKSITMHKDVDSAYGNETAL